MSAALARAGAPWPNVDLALLRELGDLKRVTSAGRAGSIATRLFRRGWSALAAGAPADAVAFGITAEALAATRLGDLDGAALLGLGLSPDAAHAVRAQALDGFATLVDRGLYRHLQGALARDLPEAGPPAFVAQLADQPRAGATCPGRARIVLQPAENHAEHCVVVAVYGVLLAPVHGADPGTVFLAAMAHHLHNAAMPDSGFTGEMLLGAHLEPVMARATAQALDTLPAPLRANVEAARAVLPDASTAEGRAFHAADVLDRVLEIEQHLRAAQVGMDDVLGEMELVHAGPVKPFHDGVLRAYGLL